MPKIVFFLVAFLCISSLVWIGFRLESILGLVSLPFVAVIVFLIYKIGKGNLHGDSSDEYFIQGFWMSTRAVTVGIIVGLFLQYILKIS